MLRWPGADLELSARGARRDGRDGGDRRGRGRRGDGGRDGGARHDGRGPLGPPGGGRLSGGLGAMAGEGAAVCGHAAARRAIDHVSEPGGAAGAQRYGRLDARRRDHRQRELHAGQHACRRDRDVQGRRLRPRQ